MTRKPFSYLPWLTAPLAGAMLVYLLQSREVRREWAAVSGSAPVLDCPTAIEMGEQEWGQEARARFAIANRGGQELVLDQIRTSCGCAGLERDLDTGSSHIEELHLQPGERADLAIRVTPRGQVGSRFRTIVALRTNDPTQPDAAIELLIAKLSGGVSSVPTNVIFGSVPLGTDARQVLEVRDTAVPVRSIKSVASSCPELFSVRLLSPASASGPERHNTAGALLGRVEVRVDTREPRTIDGDVLIYLDDPSRGPSTVPVTGRVAAAVEAFPESVVLPRASAKGPIYFANCLCRCAAGKSLSLQPEQLPRGISVKVSPVPHNSSQKVVRISVDPAAASRLVGEVARSLSFGARVGDKQERLKISLLVRAATP